MRRINRSEAVADAGRSDPRVQGHLGFDPVPPVDGVGLEEDLLDVQVHRPAARRGDIDAGLDGRAEAVVDRKVEAVLVVAAVEQHVVHARTHIGADLGLGREVVLQRHHRRQHPGVLHLHVRGPALGPHCVLGGPGDGLDRQTVGEEVGEADGRHHIVAGLGPQARRRTGQRGDRVAALGRDVGHADVQHDPAFLLGLVVLGLGRAGDGEGGPEGRSGELGDHLSIPFFAAWRRLKGLFHRAGSLALIWSNPPGRKAPAKAASPTRKRLAAP